MRYAIIAAALVVFGLAGCATTAEADHDTHLDASTHGVGHDANPTRLKLFTQACSKGKASACTQLGLWYETGDHVDKDLTRAATLFESGCEGGNPEGCVQLGLLHKSGALGESDSGTAGSYFTRACAMQHEAGCTLSRSLEEPVEQ